MVTTAALTIIRDEHEAIRAVLHALRHLVQELRQGHAKPDFEALRTLIFYIDAFPERLHHPKESNHLFRYLRARSPHADALLDKLEREHAYGEQEVLRMEHLLLEYEMLGEGRFAAFAAAVEAYCDGYIGHMQAEEEHVLPLASELLTQGDWARVNAEFALNRDPLTGYHPEKEFAALFSRIVNLLPPPLGVGAAAERPEPQSTEGGATPWFQH
ncbi:MAG TPA: hemerythrin domain-containing protein [Ramlibacter sp.]|nr:hemerythrin domain-containing protein [Ramlibacter sp.]